MRKLREVNDIKVIEISKLKVTQLMLLDNIVGVIAIYRLTNEGEIFDFYPVMFDYDKFEYYDTIIKETIKLNYDCEII